MSLLKLDLRPSPNRRIAAQPDVSAPPPSRGRGHSPAANACSGLVALREFGESAVALGRLLRITRPLLSAGETAALPVKLQRFSRLLGEEAVTLRLLSRLREEELTTFARATRGVELTATTTLDQLLAVSPEVAAAVNRTRTHVDALRELGEAAGRLSDNALAGFRRLVGAPKVSEENLVRLMRTLQPGGDAELFMTAVNALPDRAFGGGGRSVGFFAGLAERPRVAEFVLDDGYDSFASLFKRAKYDWDTFDEYLVGLGRMGEAVPAAEREAAYARLLAGLADEEAATLRALDEARAAVRAAAGRKVILRYTEAQLDDLVRKTPDIKVIRKLGTQMNPGARGSLFERWLNHHVFKRPIGERRARMRLVDGDNAFDMLASERSCDFLTTEGGDLIIWDGKLYDRRTGIDIEQALDWQEANLAEKVALRDSAGEKVERTISGVGYIFSDRAAAEANLMKVVTWAGGEVWYIDEFGVLTLLR